MNDATETIMVLALAIVGVTVFLTLFFKALRKSGKLEPANTETIRLRGVIGKTTRVTVHLSTGKIFEDVRLAGFTKADSFKQAFPYEMAGMTVPEHKDGSKTAIQSKLIRMVEIPSAASEEIG